jgi:hypothetical protein
MKPLTLITAITASITSSSCYAGVTEVITGDGVELIAKYDLVGEQFERTDVNGDVMAALSGDFPFRVFFIDALGYDHDRIVYFDENGGVSKCIREEDIFYEEVFPIGEEGHYIWKTPGILDFERSFSYYSLYGPDGNLLSKFRGFAEPKVCGTGDYFAINNVEGSSRIPIEGKEDEDVPYFSVFDLSGVVIGESFIPIGYGMAAFEKDVDRFIAVDPAAIERNSYSDDIPRGTRVFDKSGSLLFTLNDGIYIDPFRNNYASNYLYGSENYICHVGTKASLLTHTDDRYDIEYYEWGNFLKNLVLEVYDGEGSFLWDYEINGAGQLEGSIFVSDNEDFLCLIVRSEAKIIVFDTNSGEVIKEVYFPPGGNPMFEHHVSDDGVYIAISILTSSRKTVYLFKDYDIVAEFSIGARTGGLNSDLTPDGDYLMVGGPDEIHLYKIQ